MIPDVQQMPRDVPGDKASLEAQTTLPTPMPTPRAGPTTSIDQPPVTRLTSGRGWNWFLQALGVTAAFGGGVAFWVPLLKLNLPLWDIEPVLVGFVAALLLRSWWSLLVAPVAFSLGLFAVATAVVASKPQDVTVQDLFESSISSGAIVYVVAIVGLLVLYVVAGVSFGMGANKLLEQRRHRAGSTR